LKLIGFQIGKKNKTSNKTSNKIQQQREIIETMSAENFEEKEIFPGVYMTDFRRRKPTNTSTTNSASTHTQAQISAQDLKELQNKIFHLQRSNEEMKAFDVNKEDSVIQEAISENLILLEEYKQKEKIMKMELELLSKHQM